MNVKDNVRVEAVERRKSPVATRGYRATAWTTCDSISSRKRRKAASSIDMSSRALACWSTAPFVSERAAIMSVNRSINLACLSRDRGGTPHKSDECFSRVIIDLSRLETTDSRCSCLKVGTRNTVSVYRRLSVYSRYFCLGKRVSKACFSAALYL